MNHAHFSYRSLIGGGFLVFLCVWQQAAIAQTDGGDTPCHHEGGADLIVGAIQAIGNFVHVDERDAFSIGTTFCNLGDEGAVFVHNTNQHPVLAQNMYRLKDGRFEQIGMSWLPHSFFALSNNQCGCGCTPTGGTTLGVGCSNSDTAGINGSQVNMGPRSQVNAHTGVFAFPFGSQGMIGNSVYKRLRVHVDDLSHSLNEGALYFAEGQVVSPDDAANGFQNNNASYREILIGPQTSDDSTAVLTSSTVLEQPAIRAWRTMDPSVVETDVQVPDEGLFILAAKAHHLSAGVWHYEYALHNLNSDRSGGSFGMPVAEGTVVSELGFHQVSYHSGEPYDLTHWPGEVTADGVTWSTVPFASNPNANALRWGTLYNFRFDANRPPVTGNVTIGLFKPGSPESVIAETLIPANVVSDYDGDGDLDLSDYVGWPFCLTGPTDVGLPAQCAPFDVDFDDDVDLLDFSALMNSFGL